MIVEFQMDSGRFRQLMRQRIASSWPGYAGSIVYQGKTCYVAGIDITDVMVLQGTQSVTRTLNAVGTDGKIGPPESGGIGISFQPAIARVFGVLLVSREGDMKAAGLAAAPTSSIPILGVDFTLNLEVNEDGGVELVATLASLPGTGLSQADLQALTEQLSVRSSINLRSALGAMSSYLPDILNAGVALNGDASVIALRLDTDAPSQTVANRWTTFLGGNFTSRLSGNDWAMFIPQHLLVQPLEDELSEHLEKDDTKEKFRTVSGPDATWAPIGFSPRSRVTLSGEVIDACVGIDMNVDATIGVTFSVPQQNILRVRTVIDFSLSPDEEVACIFANALLWLPFGPWTLVDNDIENVGWWSFLGVFIDWPLRLGGAIGYLKSDLPLQNLPEMKNWVKVSDTERYKDIDFPDADVFGGEMALTAITAETTGAVMKGSITVEAPEQMSLTVFKAEFSGWSSKSPCHNYFDFEGTIDIPFGGQPLGDPPKYLVRVAAVDVMFDPVGQYSNKDFYFVAHSSWLDSGKLTIKLNNLKEAFEQNPYPLEVRILTTRGVRWITVPPPPSPPSPPTDEQELFWFNMNFLKWKVANCYQLVSMLDKLSVLYPGWLVDPPPDFIFTRHWFAEVTAQRPGRTLALRDQVSGDELVSMRVPQSGRVGIAARVDPTRANPRAAIALGLDGAFLPEAEYLRAQASLPAPSDEPQTRVGLRQTVMVRVGQVRLSSPVTDLRMDYQDGVPVVHVATTGAFVTVKAPDDGTTTIAEHHPQPGMTGFLRRRGVIHVLGEEGFAPLGTRAMQGRALAKRRASSRPLALADGSRFVAMLTNEGLEVLDDDLETISRIAAPGGIGVVAFGSRVVIATRSELVSFDLAEPRRPRELGVAGVKGVHRMGHAPLAGYRHALWLQQSPDSSFSVLDLTDAKRPDEIGRFPDTPWFVDRARLGKLVAHLSGDRRTLTFWRDVDTRAGLTVPPRFEDIVQR